MRAFTLAELSVALAISSILVVGAGVVLTSTMSAVDRGAGSAATQSDMRRALATINADAAVAIDINTSTPNELSMSVPDRTGDGAIEFVRYTWSGTRGDPLVRVVNGSSQTLLDDVRAWTFASIRRPGPLLATFTGQTIAEHNPASVSGSYSFGRSIHICVAAKPVLPAHTKNWSLQSAAFLLSRAGAGRTIIVEARAAAFDGTPTATVLASASLSGDTLSNQDAWMTFSLPVSDITPGVPIAIVLRGLTTDSAASGKLGVSFTGGMPNTLTNWESQDAGATWAKPSSAYFVPVRLIGSFTTETEQ